MKTRTFLLTIAMLFCMMTMGQKPTTEAKPKFTIDKATGKVVKDTTKAVKTADKVYQVVDGVTFYQGARGGIYCLKVSKKTGKEYKSYVK